MPKNYKYLSPKGRKGLDDYKYVSGTYTFLDLQMNKFWVWAIDFVPLSIAPNMITLLGLLCNAIGSLAMVYCSPDFEKPVPAWANVLCGVNLFIYQTLDALDGKQARRTKSASALGQLFDHGCDAVSTMLCAVSLCACMQTGPWVALTFILFSGTGFFSAQWNEYYTHVLSTNIGGVFGVTEAQLTIVAIHLGTAYLGNEFWNYQFSGPTHIFDSSYNFTPRDCFVYFTLAMSVTQWASSAAQSVRTKGASALLTQIPIAMICVLYAVLLFDESEMAVIKTFSPLPQIIVGISICLMSSRIIVEGLCRMPFNPLQVAACGAFVAAGILHFLPSFPLPMALAKAQKYFWAVYCTFVVFTYLHYTLTVMREIAEHLGINILSIDISWMREEERQRTK